MFRQRIPNSRVSARVDQHEPESWLANTLASRVALSPRLSPCSLPRVYPFEKRAWLYPSGESHSGHGHLLVDTRIQWFVALQDECHSTTLSSRWAQFASSAADLLFLLSFQMSRTSPSHLSAAFDFTSLSNSVDKRLTFQPPSQTQAFAAKSNRTTFLIDCLSTSRVAAALPSRGRESNNGQPQSVDHQGGLQISFWLPVPYSTVYRGKLG